MRHMSNRRETHSVLCGVDRAKMSDLVFWGVGGRLDRDTWDLLCSALFLSASISPNLLNSPCSGLLPGGSSQY